ncbi:hypothetical protein CAPTEDRAFT_154459 [Capitella teleta]|uniref:Protein NDRG3 n=1 Tax=Capitella teleta TaxID=283909 RepID=R7VD58_CAPTE|nr:hypothetical protein CAPTEDRAFT_154459 [Capitella teleta]|eukprot:ELU16758.1 hypothetical protein CAPTEDRAFT_154459 [Capitella teleta]
MAERMAEVELSSVVLHDAEPRSLLSQNYTQMACHLTDSQISIAEDDVETAMGIVHVHVQGNRSKPAIVTYHDIGLSGVTAFQGFFNHSEMQPLLKHFCVYHVTAPGQQDGALPLPQGLGFLGDASLMNNYQYPSMDHLAEMLLPVMQFYGMKRFIGFGVGAGANVLARFGLMHADKVEGLVLVNCSAGKSSWTEWGYQKLNAWHLKSGQLSAQVEEYLLWHWFGSKTMCENHDLMMVFSDYIKAINPQNLSHYIQSYIKRTDLGLVRETDPSKRAQTRNFKFPVMLVAGESSPHLDQVVQMNARLDPADSTWMKFECGGMVLEEAPDKMAEAFRLFLQGMGYVPSLSQTKIVGEHEAARRASMSAGFGSGSPARNAAPANFNQRRVSHPVTPNPEFAAC